MRPQFLHIICLILIGLVLPVSGFSQFYQGSVQEFGKNRIQYNGFSWKYHHYKRFKIYYSGANQDLASYTAQTMHHYLIEAEAKLDYKFPEQLDVIVYESQSKFRQSNLGVNNDEYSNVAGTGRLLGSKVFVYFEGDHQKFNKSIKSAVYHVLLKHMFYGGDWKDQVKSTVNSGMPAWIEEGLVNFFVEHWNADVESNVKDLVLTRKIDRFNDLTEKEKIYAGHALWNYIAENHGLAMIPNILYVSRITKNIERGFYSLLNMDYTNLSRNYIAFYRARYVKEYENQSEADGDQVEIKNKKESVYYGLKISPDGDKIAYVENVLGRYKVKIRNLITGKTTTIYKAESKLERIQDYSYPTLEWHPSGQALSFFTERKGEVKFCIYSLLDKELSIKVMKQLEKVLSFAYSPDGKKIVFSGVFNGQSDLYLYEVLSNTKKQITNDIYDDLNPQFADENSRVIFASNRKSDTIFKAPNIEFFDAKSDIFIYDLKQVDRTYKYLERLTNTENEDESNPYQLENGNYIFLSEKNGLNNRFTARKDSAISFIDTTIHYRYFYDVKPQTNYVTSILEHDYKNGKYAYLMYQNSQYKFFNEDYSGDVIDVLWNTTYRQKEVDAEKRRLDKKKAEDNDTLYIDGQKYQKEIVYIDDVKPIVDENDSTKKDSSKVIKEPAFEPPKYLIYKVNFARDYVLSQFDNNFLFPNYQPYGGPGSVYFNPGVNMLLKIGASDLFDDYKLLGGTRIPTRFNSGGEFLFMAQHLRDRFDHRLVIYRQKNVSDVTFAKWITHDIRYRLTYPLNEVWGLRATTNARQDRQVFIPYNEITLQRDPENFYNAGLNLELVLDNTIPMELNIRRGTRFKLFAEYLQEIGGNNDPTFNLGFDFRNYTRIKRNFIWVNRLAGATSLGDRKLLYYMGGVDNWVLRPSPDFDPDIDVNPNLNWGFQTIATPMRGFIQNARNGNSFLLYNSEFRLPVVSYFSSYPVKSEMLRHLQLIAFGDAGVAWTGPHPFHPDNYFNTQIIEDLPVTIKLENLREPIIGGFGVGVRTKIWGYFIRLDAAWGIEDLAIKKPLAYISLTQDL
ncbi:MAG: hypothetical protein MK078_15860 [Crocinitomicaceae bacterium]|nr:hypothetical protein [Crocinitomicaceae bacterium]